MPRGIKKKKSPETGNGDAGEINGRNPNSDNGEEPYEGLKRGFFLLPNLLTTGSLFCAFWAMVSVLYERDFRQAAFLIIFSGIFDALDGKVARWTKTTSPFGVQYDSLSDLVSFGVAPAIIAHNWGLQFAHDPRLGWLVAFLFLLCGALRLARFNVHTGEGNDDPRFFTGLPIPGGAMFIIATVLFFGHMGWTTEDGFCDYPNLLLVAVLLVALLMVSRFKYYSFKDTDLVRKRPMWILVLVAMLIIIIVVERAITLYTVVLVYVLHGPFLWYFSRESERLQRLRNLGRRTR